MFTPGDAIQLRTQIYLKADFGSKSSLKIDNLEKTEELVILSPSGPLKIREAALFLELILIYTEICSMVSNLEVV